MTGVDAVRNGATSVTAGRAFVRRGVPFLPEMFRQAGYRTGLFGKWHLGDNYPHRPNDRGFDEAVYHLGWGFTAAPEFTNTLFDGRYFHNGQLKRFAGHCSDFWFDEATRWMKERREKGEPFFCYLPTNAPHAPHDVAEKYSKPYEGKGPAKFFGMIAQLDENLGKLEEFLKSSGLRDNTIVIFMTDNGGTAGVKTFNAGMRAGKTTYYDGGHRVPCWIRWPNGRLGEPRDIDVPTQNTDIAPTLIHLAAIPFNESPAFDGADLAGLLTRGEPLRDRMLVVQYGQQIEKHKACVIWNKWRLVHGTELYDIKADPAQETDLAAKQPEVVARMKDHYEAWWKGVEPLIHDYVATSLGSKAQPDVALTSSDWQDIYADNSNHIRSGAGGPRGGKWNVRVERPGRYEFTLRRWPAELDVALSEAHGKLNNGEPAKAFPIASAVLSVAGTESLANTKPGARSITFERDLPVGSQALQAWFRDKNGTDLCGAYFVDVKLVKANE